MIISRTLFPTTPGALADRNVDRTTPAMSVSITSDHRTFHSYLTFHRIRSCAIELEVQPTKPAIQHPHYLTARHRMPFLNPDTFYFGNHVSATSAQSRNEVECSIFKAHVYDRGCLHLSRHGMPQQPPPSMSITRSVPHIRPALDPRQPLAWDSFPPSIGSR